MKTKLTILIILCFGIANAQEGYELKTKMYKSVLDLVMKSTSIDKIANDLKMTDLKSYPVENTGNNDSYSVILELAENDKIMLTYLYSDNKIYQISLIHSKEISNYIINYLDYNTSNHTENEVWFKRNSDLMFRYKIKGQIAVLEMNRLSE